MRDRSKNTLKKQYQRKTGEKLGKFQAKNKEGGLPHSANSIPEQDSEKT